MKPPLILRHVTPWWLLAWIDRLCPSLCWTGMVMWRLGYAWDWRRDSGCGVPCYCGKVRPAAAARGGG